VTTDLFCLHGFLGAAADWKQSFAAARADGQVEVQAVDWLAEFGTASATWDALAARVNSWAREAKTSAPQHGARRPILVGYSLGGRVAMHALIAAPEQWSGAVIISANPGLASRDERDRRREHDAEWAARFRRDEWRRTIADWNAQPVFAGEDPQLSREESDDARAAAVVGLERWSLGTQRDLRPGLRALGLPVLWLAGERDTKYVALMRECAGLNPRFAYAEVPGAGHRAPWTRAPYFEKVVRDWMDTVPALASQQHEDAQPT